MSATPLISVLLPTRKRPIQLMRAVHSLLAVCADLEVLIYVHGDDMETIESMILWVPNSRVLSTIGKPRNIEEQGELFTLMAKSAHGQFLWFFNDDCTAEGIGLSRVNLAPGVIYQPEFHQLNQSVYVRDENCPFFLIHKDAMEGVPFQHPIDLSTLRLLRAKGWPTEFIPGLTVWHDRKEKHCKEIEHI